MYESFDSLRFSTEICDFKSSMIIPFPRAGALFIYISISVFVFTNAKSVCFIEACIEMFRTQKSCFAYFFFVYIYFFSQLCLFVVAHYCNRVESRSQADLNKLKLQFKFHFMRENRSFQSFS